MTTDPTTREGRDELLFSSVHPMTCGNADCRSELIGDAGRLLCPKCDYVEPIYVSPFDYPVVKAALDAKDAEIARLTTICDSTAKTLALAVKEGVDKDEEMARLNEQFSVTAGMLNYEIEKNSLLEQEIERLKKEFTDEMTETVHELSSEITRLNDKLAKLRDGIAEVVIVEGADQGIFRLSQVEFEWRLYAISNPSLAGEKLAQLYRESDPQETPKA